MYRSEDVMKIPLLVEEDSLTTYQGHSAQQNQYAYSAFYEFLEEVRPFRILEIGTGMGGFTRSLKTSCDDIGIECEITSVDKHECNLVPELREMGVNAIVQDYFYNNYKEVDSFLTDYIKQKGTTLVLCDGGHKVREFHLLAPHLKEGDFIMAHDYAPSREYFEENIYKKYWNWLEIEEADVEKCCEEFNLVEYRPELFTKAVWMCKRKIA